MFLAVFKHFQEKALHVSSSYAWLKYVVLKGFRLCKLPKLIIWNVPSIHLMRHNSITYENHAT